MIDGTLKEFIKNDLKQYLEKDDIKGAYDKARLTLVWEDLRAIFMWFLELGLPVLEAMGDTLPSYFFSYSNISEVSIPTNIESISLGAFAHCEQLTSVTFSEGLYIIGEHAFYLCDLHEVVFPESLVRVEDCAFARCENLQTVKVLGDTYINPYAFTYCGSVDIYLPDRYAASFTELIKSVEMGWDTSSNLNIIMY